MPNINQRYLSKQILEDLNDKMVFLAGPRQVGKTTLAKTLLKSKANGTYLNWDLPEHRKRILKQEMPLSGLVVLDEIHKYRSWRNFIKGFYDVYKDSLQILVTGSAKLDLYRRGGDSLQGRYHMLHLHPFTVAELKLTKPAELNRLLERSGFPEPYFAKSSTAAKRWSEEYRQRLIYDDVRDLEKIVDLAKLELLMLHLPQCVGSTLSINSVREDLEVSHKAVTHWLKVLENLCYIYRVPPFVSKKMSSLKKEQKAYLFDWSLIENPAARFENMIAGHLLKWVQYQQDTQGERYALHFYRDVEKREVDFIITHNAKPVQAIECKLSDSNIDPSLVYFKKKFPDVDAYQICHTPRSEYRNANGIQVISALHFLKNLI